jgi:flagellar protein FliL
MSAAAVDAVEAPKQKKRISKKLLIILVAVTALLLGAGGAAFYVMKQRAAAAAAAAAAEDGEETAEAATEPEKKKKKEHKSPPFFLPLDAFVVNLADREQERYAQVGITLQIEDPKIAEELKLYMPAIRNGVLMILAHKTSAELLEREGKERLAEEIMREVVRPLGIELDPPAAAASGAPARKKKRVEPEVHNPVEHVHFSSFIIQ